MSKKAMFLLDDDSPGAGPIRPVSPLRDAGPSSLGSGAIRTSSFDLNAARQSFSCVTRETFQEDCARHRFIVWAAVKRNSSRSMPSSKKLECPLLKCSREFPEHESMLRHLAGCVYLASGEYWCYDHMRVERFDDLKCKRCLGHPSKRKKMLSMAKSFFHSLGHKSKKTQTLGYDPDDSLLQPPPSYDSLCIPPSIGNATELSSANEIVEIDSREVGTVHPADLLVPSIPDPSLPELDSSIQPVNPFTMQWQPTMMPSPPFSFGLDDCGSRGASTKPALTLQVNTAPPARRPPRPVPREVPVAPRSKGLSPSSSVRSNASTDTTASTNSNVSSLMSPSSNWSGIWSVPSGLNTNLTSPVEALVEDPWADAQWNVHDFCHELPADFPVSKPAESLQLDPLMSFETPQPEEVLFNTDVQMNEDLVGLADLDVPELGESNICCSEAKSVVGLAWDSLQEHVLSSTLKIQDTQGNHLADQLKSMSPKTIAMAGLRTLCTLLDGGQPSSGIDTLCFVHLVYAFSLAVHEKDASRNLKPFFLQSLSYVHSLSPKDRHAYTQLVFQIWQPTDVGRAEVNEYFATGHTVSLSRSSSLKGKDRDIHDTYSMLSAARDFLDDLEMSIVMGQTPSSLEVQTSELFTKHLLDSGAVSPVNQDFVRNISLVLERLAAKFSDTGNLRGKLEEVYQRANEGILSSVRKAEIEMLSAGKDCMPAVRFFDDYTPEVRELCDLMYMQHDNGTSRRNAYHQAGIVLTERLLSELDKPSSGAVFDNNADLDAFFDDLTNSTLDFQLRAVSPLDGCDGAEFLQISAVVSPAVETPLLSAAAERQQSTETASGETSEQQGQKVEADACCDICGYRPKGDPQWFKGSMAKHRKLQHSKEPPKIYKCPYPGCTSQYKNRPDNLRQHQIEKNHWVDGEEPTTSRRPSKRKKVEADE